MITDAKAVHPDSLEAKLVWDPEIRLGFQLTVNAFHFRKQLFGYMCVDPC